MVILMARVMVTAMAMAMGAMEVHIIKIISDLFGLGLKN